MTTVNAPTPSAPLPTPHNTAQPPAAPPPAPTPQPFEFPRPLQDNPNNDPMLARWYSAENQYITARHGYQASFWQDPRTVVRYYQALKSAPKGFTPPPGFDPTQIEAAYKYMQYRNNNKPDNEWKYLPPDDPALPMLSSMKMPSAEWLAPQDAQKLSDPSAVMRGELNWNELRPDARQKILSDPNFDIAKYPAAIRPEILADPSFDWKKVPAWQKIVYDIQSSPAGSTIQGAALGAVPGAIAGGPIGALVGGAIGGALGWLAGVSGYDPTKNFWEQPNLISGSFGALQWPVEQMEKTFGLMKQVEGSLKDPQKFGTTQEIFNNLGAAYQAGGVYYASWPAMLTGQDYMIGRAEPVQLPRVYDILATARTKIEQGADPRQVALDAQQYVGGQASQLILQMGTDPLNLLPHVQNEILGKAAELTGHDVAARAFAETKSPFEAARQYKVLVQTGAVPETFKLDEMGAFARYVAGINEKGQVTVGPFSQTGLFDPIKAQTPEGLGQRIKGFVENVSTLTPESRARVGTGLFYDNLGVYLSKFEDPTEAIKYLRALGKSDMETWAGMGSRFTNSPEWYTILPALKEFNVDQLDGLLSQWDTPRLKRDMTLRIAEVLGENPSSWVEDIAKRGTFEQDYQRLAERLKTMDTPEAKALIEDIQAGRLTADSLKDIVNAFTGDGALPLTLGDWKARVLNALGSHFDEWAVKNFGLADSPEAKSTFFRTAKLVKSAQSILLLGGSPGYALQNGLSNMVSRAMTGNFGYMTDGQINGWLDRFGVNPARLGEGVGMGGDVTPNTAGLQTGEITKAMKGSGPLNNVQSVLSKISRGMPFSKLSGWFESVEGKQGYMIAMRDFWSQSWRRGVGFSKLPVDLSAELRGIHPRAENAIYAAIEAGMNQGEIEKALTGRLVDIQSRSLVNDAAQRLNIPANEAAHMLEKIGVLDALDQYLKGANTPDKVYAAFERAQQAAQDSIDLQASRDIVARTEYVKQRLNAEGPAALLDIYSDTEAGVMERWLDHYGMFDDTFAQLDAIDDPAIRSKLIDETYARSNAEWRRTNSWQSSTYQGIFETLGLGENDAANKFLATLSDTHSTMDAAYQFMRDSWRTYSEKYSSDWENMLRYTERDNIKASINQKFNEAFAREHQNNVQMGDLVGRQFENQFGPAAGEAARMWWKDIVDFRDQMTQRLQQFRSQVESLPYDQRAAAKQEFYRKVYQPMIVESGRIKLEGAARMQNVASGHASPETITTLTHAAETRTTEAMARTNAEAATRNQNIWQVAQTHGISLFDINGQPVQGYETKLLATARKYLPWGEMRGVTGPEQLTPEMMDRAFTLREQTLAAEALGLVPLEQAPFGISKIDALNERLTQLLDTRISEQANRLPELNNELDALWKSLPENAPAEFVDAMMAVNQRLESAMQRVAQLDKVAGGQAMAEIGVQAQQTRAEEILQNEGSTATTEKFVFEYNPAEAARMKAELLDGIDLKAIKAKAKAMRDAAGLDTAPAATLFQSDNLPFGMYEEAAQQIPHSQVMDEGWSQHVQPLLDAMREESLRRLKEPSLGEHFKGLSNEGQTNLRKYINNVKNEMASNKLTTVRWGENQRDFAMLNYNRRFGADRYADLPYPYQFFFTRTLLNTGMRLIDKPAWFANYGRLQQFTNKYPNPNIPERLRGKIKIPAPWLPEWMGDGLYVDPLRMLFTPANFTRPLEQMQSDKNQQLIEAERLLQTWAADGTVSDADLQQAVSSHSGSVWERAFAQAQINRQAEISSPFDFMNAFMGPAWYVTTPWKLATGQGQTITNLPLTNTARAVQTVTAGTPLEPIGKFIGLFGKPEEWARDKLALPQYGEFGDYYVKRQLANMVADGEISVADAQTAMAQGNGPAWDAAQQRVKLELAMRVPLMSEAYAALHGGAGAAAQALPVSLFGSSILPAGELKFRGLKEKWDAAWQAYDKGDKQAVQNFFTDHPEYEAYLAKNKPPADQLRAFLTGNIWDAYMSLDKANRKVVTAQMGPLFEQSFLNKETRSYDTIDTQTLAAWSRMLGGTPVPKTPSTQSVTEAPAYSFPQLEGIPAPISASLNQYQVWKDQNFPGIDNIQSIYYGVPKADRRRILAMYPQLQKYWTERRKVLTDHPEAAQFIDSQTANDILSGKQQPVGMDQQQAQRLLMYYRPSDFAAPVHTAEYYLQNASPILRTQLQDYALRGAPLGDGGMKELRLIWEQNGKPSDSLAMFLNDVIVPTMAP